MNYVKHLNLFGIEAKEIPCITGSGAPTTATVAAVGMFYMDASSGDVYKCVSVNSNKYTWEPIDTKVDLSGYVQSINGAKPDPETGDVKLTIPESGENAVQYVPQELTEEQKAQVRENIGAVKAEPGTHAYTGERITLTKHTFDYTQLFNTTENGVGMQDGCAYGDYYFQFTPNGKFGVYDLRNNSFVGAFDLDQKDVIMPHCNSACFSGKFYQPTDQFPLVYVNAYNNEGLPLGTCYVYRILQDGNTFSTQLVQTIQIGFTDSDLWISTDNELRPYGNFVVDSVNKFLYAYTTRDADKTTRFFKFALPEMKMQGTGATMLLDYDVSASVDNKTCNETTGLVGNATTMWLTDYMAVGNAVGVSTNLRPHRVFCFDAEHNFIGFRAVGAESYDTDLIAETAYVRVAFHKNYVTYEDAPNVTIKGLMHIASTLEYDPNAAEDGKALSGNSVTDIANYWMTGYIPTEGRTSCWFSFKPFKLAFFDSEKAFISSPYAQSNIVNIPDGAAYVRAQYSGTQNTPFETAQSLVVLDAEPEDGVNSNVILTEDDIIDRFDTDHFAIPQGCECHNERLYVTSGWGDASTGSFLHVVDTETKREVSTIDFLNILYGEPEAVTVVNNRLLYGAGGTMYELLV